jgi:putative ABC transport system permease protein
MKDNNDYWLGVDKCEVMIGVTDQEQYNKVQSIIKNDDRIKYYLSSNLDSTVTMRWKKGMPSTDMQGFVYDDFTLADIPITKGRNPKAGNEIALSSKIAREKKKEIGDYIEVYLEGEKKLNLLITGIFQTYNELGDACRMTTAIYTDNNFEVNYNNFSIYLKDNENIDSFIKDIKKKAGSSGNVIPRTEAFSSIMNYIVAPQKKAILPVCLVVLIIAGINIFCIVLLKNASSEKINGIYKSIGYSTGHLILSNLYYVGIIAVVSVAVALPLTMVLYPGIMKTSLGMFGFIEYPVDYNLWHIAWTNITVLFIFVISTLLSSRSLKRVSVRDLIQE